MTQYEWESPLPQAEELEYASPLPGTGIVRPLPTAAVAAGLGSCRDSTMS